jgi:hypothetical protein
MQDGTSRDYALSFKQDRHAMILIPQQHLGYRGNKSAKADPRWLRVATSHINITHARLLGEM